MQQISNNVFAPVSATTNSFTSAAISLSSAANGANGAFSVGNVTVTGTALTTVTFAVLGSSDGGQNFFSLNISAFNTSGTVATTATATVAGLYQVNLVGITHIKFQTSGTFTATKVNFQLTGSPVGMIH